MSEKSIEDLINEILEDPPDKSSSSNKKLQDAVTIELDIISSSLDIDCDGLIAVKKGKIVIKPPQGTGKYPTITPGKGVRIIIDDVEIKERTIVTEESKVDIYVADEEPVSSYEITFSENELIAYICVKAHPGKRYVLMDQEELSDLILIPEMVEEVPPPQIPINNVLNEMQTMSINSGIDKVALEEELKSPTGKKIVVAMGQPPLPPQDAHIKYLFSMDERTEANISSTQRKDYFDHGEFQSVDIGMVLAVKKPGVKGKNGISVTGNEIPVNEPKDIEIKAGEGVDLINDGQKAVAAISGRPVLGSKQGLIKVLPQIVFPGDVDIHTGRVHFKGDVLIRGNVMDGLTVTASGRVTVFGNVYSAQISAGGDVLIAQNLVGGMISAGGEGAFFSRTLPVLTKLQASIRRMLEASEQLKRNPLFGMKDLHVNGDGSLVKLLIDMKFKDIPKAIEGLNQYLASLASKPNPYIIEFIELMTAKFIGLGPLNMISLNEVAEIEHKLHNMIKIGEESLDNIATVSVNYSQNSYIEATGSVNINGPGSYHTDIYAGQNVSVAGVCRGGAVQAGGDVSIAQLGSTAGVKTVIETAANRKIKAGQIFPNVYLTVGHHTFKFDSKMLDVQCYWHTKNGLTVQTGKVFIQQGGQSL